MTNIVIWGAYPSVLKAASTGCNHIEGLGDGVLWWLSALLVRLANDGFNIVFGDNRDFDSLESLSNTIVIFIDLPLGRDAVASRLYSVIPKAHRVLFRLEPPAISPIAYRSHTTRRFGALVRVEPSAADNLIGDVLDFNVPIDTNLPIHPNYSIRQGICAISSHKRIIGPRGKMYKLREEIYREIAAVIPNFTLFGTGWNRYVSGVDHIDWLMRKFQINLAPFAPRAINYKGPIADKSDIIRFNYSLIIENYIGTTYISEKLFDSLKYGVIPIYYGGVDLTALGLSDIVFQAKDQRDIVHIARNLPPAPPRQEVQKRYAEWLGSPFACRFRVDFCFNNIKKLIEDLPVFCAE